MISLVLGYLAYFGAAFALLIVAGAAYVFITPYNEIALIRAGNSSAAIALAGAMIGYAAVVYSATAHGATLMQMVLWSVVAFVTQVIATEVVLIVFHDFRRAMEDDDIAHGIALGSFSLAVGLINAGCLTP